MLARGIAFVELEPKKFKYPGTVSGKGVRWNFGWVQDSAKLFTYPSLTQYFVLINKLELTLVKG